MPWQRSVQGLWQPGCVFTARSGACSLHSQHPGCSASEHSSCLLITLIIENYRFSVGNVYLHPTFPKLPISIAVMSHPPVPFRQHWPLYLQAAWATPGHRQLPPGTALAVPCMCCKALRASAAMQALPVLPAQASAHTHCWLLGECLLHSTGAEGTSVGVILCTAGGWWN